jgi:hypothetical protein
MVQRQLIILVFVDDGVSIVSLFSEQARFNCKIGVVRSFPRKPPQSADEDQSKISSDNR